MISFYFYNFRGNADDKPERRPIDPQAFGFARGRFGEVPVFVSEDEEMDNLQKGGRNLYYMFG